jgi:hypothetical protein
MSAPSRPRLGPLLACWLYRAIAGAIVAAPFAVAFGTVTGGHPRGDVLLFENGGMWLVEAMRLIGASIPGLMRSGGLIVLLTAFGWLLPLGALIASLESGRPRWRDALMRSGECFGGLSILMGTTLLLRALLFALLVAVGSLISGDSPSPWRKILGVAVPFAGLLSWWLLDLFQDAIRVVRIHSDTTLWGSIKDGSSLLWSRLRSAMLAAGWRTLIALITFAAALVVARKLTGGNNDRLIGVIFLHQFAVLVHVICRASWFRWLTARLEDESIPVRRSAIPPPPESLPETDGSDIVLA